VRTTDTIAAFRKARAGFTSIGLVPTMGYLHDGHLSLVRRAKAECGAAAVSIFVNPTQFNRSDDLAAYPRDLDRDLVMLADAGADLVFTPAVETIYPPGFDAHVLIGGVSEGLEGGARPGHFNGVATVVLKLLNIAQPTRAYFGQKDAQQLSVIRRMVRDLDVPVRVVAVPTVRDADGLALSSRNRYLSPAGRALAVAFAKNLQLAARKGPQAASWLSARLKKIPGLRLDYAEVAEGRLCAAVKIGRTRLIDNERVRPPSSAKSTGRNLLVPRPLSFRKRK
jgi:pantoate--beta-alanine ligase